MRSFFSILSILISSVSIAQGGDSGLLVGETIDTNVIELPESPTSGGINAVNSPDVNLATGTPVITIPLYTYEVDGVKVPISLSYDASGVKVSQMATAVGLNWNLNVGGQISRTIRSKADENSDWGWIEKGPLTVEWFDSYDQNPNQWQRDMIGKPLIPINGLAKNTDHNPDLFSYSFLGYSGTFLHPSRTKIIEENKSQLKINPFTGSGNAMDDQIDIDDFFGNTYHFGCKNCHETKNNLEKSNNRHTLAVDGSNLPFGNTYEFEEGNFRPVTTWKLHNIQTKNSKEINFSYFPVLMDYHLSAVEGQITVGHGCEKKGERPKVKSNGVTSVHYEFTTQLIDSISSPDSDILVLFHYGEDQGLPESVWKTKLERIEIKNLRDSRLSKEFIFEYLRFNGDPRLQLHSIVERGKDENMAIVESPPYIFTYKGNSLPSKNSKSQDLYGYFNNKLGGNTLVPSMTIPFSQEFQGYFDMYSTDRSMNPSALDNGVLIRIKYPVGGSVNFTYEPNAIGDHYAGGLRVSEIFKLDKDNQVYEKQKYYYDELTGNNLNLNLSFFRKREGGATTFYSNPVVQAGDWVTGYKTGYFYGKVTVITQNGLGGASKKEEYIFEENENNFQKYDYALKTVRTFKDLNQKIKEVEYLNEKIGVGEKLEWIMPRDMMCYKESSYGDEKLGYENNYNKVEFTGNYAYLPTKITTTEFLKEGSSLKPVTKVQQITYDPETLLKKQEITDFSKKIENGNPVVNDPNAEIITENYTYPFDGDFGFASDFPKGLVIKQEVFSKKGNQNIQTAGQAYEFDPVGNVKGVYEFSKGEGNNSSMLDYIPPHYEERTRFLYANGHPVQVTPVGGVPTSYIWSKKDGQLLAKIEGVARNSIQEHLITAVENASYTGLYAELKELQAFVLDGMVTGLIYKPLAGVEIIIDPKGDEAKYEYDGFGRLIRILDSEGKIISETEYHYSEN